MMRLINQLYLLQGSFLPNTKWMDKTHTVNYITLNNNLKLV